MPKFVLEMSPEEQAFLKKSKQDVRNFFKKIFSRFAVRIVEDKKPTKPKKKSKK